MTTAAYKHTISLRASYELIGSVTVKKKCSITDHLLAVREERWDMKKCRDDVNDAKLRRIVNDQGYFDKRLFLRAKHPGSCLSIRGNTATGTVLTTTEF